MADLRCTSSLPVLQEDVSQARPKEGPRVPAAETGIEGATAADIPATRASGCPFPDDLSWFYALRQLARRQRKAALTLERAVLHMEQAMQPLIRARKRARFAARKVRRQAERPTRIIEKITAP